MVIGALILAVVVAFALGPIGLALAALAVVVVIAGAASMLW